MINPNNKPNRGPPRETLTKLVITYNGDATYPFARFMNSMKKTIAVPSFNSDSPSTRVLNLTLAPNYFNKATTATGSVADNTQPRVRA
jgi:hypothetical protein